MKNVPWVKRIAIATSVALAALSGAIGLSPSVHAATIPEPYISKWPGPVTRVWIGNVAAPEQCTRGYLCAFVERNSSGYNHTGWWEFKFYHCGVYNLAYWHEYPTWYGDDGSLVLDDRPAGSPRSTTADTTAPGPCFSG